MGIKRQITLIRNVVIVTSQVHVKEHHDTEAKMSAGSNDPDDVEDVKVPRQAAAATGSPADSGRGSRDASAKSKATLRASVGSASSEAGGGEDPEGAKWNPFFDTSNAIAIRIKELDQCCCANVPCVSIIKEYCESRYS